ncbi:MAG: hypothetical protein CBC42_01990 [Betaproteobacteria bacterium TMED82]|nr:MAG: hypothetical protein CBC42_01990 [Betaproteobacteria bacterium TMED82]|tara:strand:- start:14664 stop:15641 length:978 start_codon:yes stop_codon:yes gene_type:complete
MKIIKHYIVSFSLILFAQITEAQSQNVSVAPELIFQILASELSILEGNLPIAAATYLNIAEKTEDAMAAKRATELAMMIGDHRAALKSAQLWQKNDKFSPEASETVNALYLVLGKNEKLVTSMLKQRNLAEQNDDLDNFYLKLNGLVNRAQEPSDALKIFEEVSKNDQLLPTVLYARAMLNFRVGKPLEMENILRTLIDIKPDHAQALNALGYSMADRNVNLEEALRLIKAAIVFLPGDPHIIDSMGWVYYKLGKLEKAEEWLAQAYSSQPDAEISAHYGEVLWNLSSKDEAINVWKQGFKNNPESEILRETLGRLKVPIEQLLD